MRKAVALLLVIFSISIFSAACSNNDKKIDVDTYRQKVKENRKGSASIEKKKAVEKAVFPNIKNEK